MRLIYPTTIRRVERYMQKTWNNDYFSKASLDGRYNSIKDEQTIIHHLSQNFIIEQAPCTRSWYDFKLHSKKGTHQPIPINIKVSRGQKDNALNKKAIVYSFTDLSENDIPKAMSFNKMSELIKKYKKKERDVRKEYYYMYVDKNDGRVIVRSLCDIQNYVNNNHNWLQIAWNKEKMVEPIIKDDIDECYENIREKLAISLIKLWKTSNSVLTPAEIEMWKHLCN